MRNCKIRIKPWIALLLCSALILTACARGQEQPKQDKKVLELWHYWDLPYTRQALRRVIDEFQDAHPGIEVKTRYIPDEDFKKQLVLGMTDGTMPDIAIVDSSDVQFYHSIGHLADLTGIVEKEAYVDVALASCQSGDGTLAGIPVGVNCLVFYYNEALLAEAGVPVPETLDEFAEAATRISAVPRTGKEIYGCAFPALQSEESLFCFLPILWAKGGSVRAMDSPGSRKAFDFLRQLTVSGAMSHKTVDMTLGDVAREFKKGNIAMMFSTTMTIPDIRGNSYDLEFGVRQLPLGDEQPSVVGGEVVTVTDGEYAEEAKEFVRFLTDPERMRGYIDDMGYLAPRKDILKWQVEQDPEKQKYVEILNTARTRDFTEDWPRVSLAAADVISKVILQEDTDETFERLAETIRQIRGGTE